MSDTAVSDPPRIGVFRRWSAALRQRSFPQEFRIGPAVWPRDLWATVAHVRELTGTIEKQRAALAAQQSSLEAERAARTKAPGEHSRPKPPPAPSVDEQALVDAAIGVWQTQHRLDTAGDDGGALARQLRFHLADAWDGLAKLDVTTQVHDDEEYDRGMSLEVLAVEPRAGLTREMIIETVQPTVYRSDRMIRKGQVIVGRPERPSDS